MSKCILEMKHISKNYGGIYALNDVNLELYENEVLCLCGENGAGKSTLMKILAFPCRSVLCVDAGRHGRRRDQGGAAGR